MIWKYERMCRYRLQLRSQNALKVGLDVFAPLLQSILQGLIADVCHADQVQQRVVAVGLLPSAAIACLSTTQCLFLNSCHVPDSYQSDP